MSKKIHEIIGESQETHSVTSDLSIRQVIEYMCDKNVAAVVVCDGTRVAGVFSESDLMRRVVRKGLDLDSVRVHDVMTTPVYWISMDERYEVAKAIMVDKGLRHLVVMNDDRHFRGFVSSQELLAADLADSRTLVGKLNDDYYQQRFKP